MDYSLPHITMILPMSQEWMINFPFYANMLSRPDDHVLHRIYKHHRRFPWIFEWYPYA